MKAIRRRFTFTFLVVLVASATTAEIPSKSTEKLHEGATHVITGKVGRLYSSRERLGDYKHTHSVAAVSVVSVEKGSGITERQLLYVRFWRKKWEGDGRPEPGHFGHRGIPRTGDVVRVYVKMKKDGGYDVLSTNGFVIFDRAK